MFDKLKKALKVAKDLDTLDFNFDPNRKADFTNNPYRLHHPDNTYSIWTASGFWFVSIDDIDGSGVYQNYAVSKFGAIGKCIVWWKCQKHIRKWRESRKAISKETAQSLIKKVMEE